VPKYLTAASLALALWVGLASGEWLTGVVPAAVVFVFAAAGHARWERRARPWHDWATILLLLPPILSAVWICVGGLVTGVQRSDEARLLLEVGAGVALTGLLCTLISYHGRHHPDEHRLRTARER
jgi:hypothetical protein